MMLQRVAITMGTKQRAAMCAIRGRRTCGIIQTSAILRYHRDSLKTTGMRSGPVMTRSCTMDLHRSAVEIIHLRHHRRRIDKRIKTGVGPGDPGACIILRRGA